MNLDNVTAELRPRSEWEAVDLGARMVRRDAKAIYQCWFAITLPLFLLAALAIVYGPSPGWIPFIFWWFEPLADGAILHIISRRLFGEQVGVAATLRKLPEFAWRNIIFLLPPYRFHIARSIAIPITQLEAQRGSRRRARASVINSRIMNFGLGVTAAYQHLFLAIYLGVALVVFALIPVSYQANIAGSWFEQLFLAEERNMLLAQLCLMYAAQSVLHPWFVGAGFGLYINCRTRLEAWDIEVSFRRLVNRRGLGTPVALLLLLPFVLGDRLAAEEADIEPPAYSGYWEDEEVDAALERIYAKEALQTEEEITVWRPIHPPEEEVSSDGLDFGFLENLGRILAFLVEIWLWLLVAALLLLLYATRDLWLPYLEAGAPRQSPRRVILSSGEVSAETLPADIPAEATRLWQQGRKRGALSLLFRGSVYHLVTRHGIEVPPSATEGACVDAVNTQGSASAAALFERIVIAWVLCAYGARDPGDEELQYLCESWPLLYDGALE